MSRIHVTTFIAAPVERVFDLSRHLALYRYIFHNKNERFSAASGTNLLSKNETMSINVTHAGKTRVSLLKITDLQKPLAFTEEQVKGDLEKFKHEHHFRQIENGTIIIDYLDFGEPRDIIGKLLGKLYLKKYLEQLVRKRHEVIRNYAETEKWRAVLT
jgi:ligand-binding SRPBCC domain-containing protein